MNTRTVSVLSIRSLLVAAVILLLAVGLLAAFLPAQRAGSTDPSIALREV